MDVSSAIGFVRDTAAVVRDLAPVITYTMGSLAVGLHALAGFSRGLAAAATLTANKTDDKIARRLVAISETLDHWIARVHSVHSVIFPKGKARP